MTSFHNQDVADDDDDDDDDDDKQLDAHVIRRIGELRDKHALEAESRGMQTDGISMFVLQYDWAMNAPELYRLLYGRGDNAKGERKRQIFIRWYDRHMVGFKRPR